MTLIATPLTEPLLALEEEIMLARQMEAGVLAAEARRSGRFPPGADDSELAIVEQLGLQARQRYVRANLRLVRMVASKEARRHGLLAAEADLFQEGCIGLIQAVERFDHRRGCRFATYALYWIKAYIGVLTASRAGQLELSPGRAERLRRIKAIEMRLAQRLGRDPTVAEIAKALGRPPHWVAELLDRARPRSIEDDQGALQIVDQRAQDSFDAVLTGAFSSRELLLHLEPAMRSVLELRFGFTNDVVLNYAEIARRLDIPVSRVRRLEATALDLLRSVCPSQGW